jgi:putative transcriptional regulator
MINHHPSIELLSDFTAGELPVSIAITVSSHLELCQQCRQQVRQLTEAAANKAFEGFDDSLNIGATQPVADSLVGMEALINSITDLPMDTRDALPKIMTDIVVGGQRIPLPRALRNVALKEWQGLGKLSRSRLDLEDDERRTSLLHIAPGGNVPCHTHKGFEITLLLQGSFDDDMGHYSVGDFILLDGKHTHQPTTKEGCVCLTVSSDAIHFTQGMSKLLNPIGKFIY